MESDRQEPNKARLIVCVCVCVCFEQEEGRCVCVCVRGARLHVWPNEKNKKTKKNPPQDP